MYSPSTSVSNFRWAAIWLLGAFGAGIVGSRRLGTFWRWFGFGLLFGPVTLLFALLKRDLNNAGRITSSIIIIGLALICANHSRSQVPTSPNPCATVEMVLGHYIAAVGGEQNIKQVRSLIVNAHETEPHTFNPSSTEHNHYELKWKFPNRVVAKRSFLLPDGAFLFDGAQWSNFNGRVSHNEDRTPSWVKELRSTYPYNDYPQFMMYRVIADPLLIARTPDLYSNFAVDQRASGIQRDTELRQVPSKQ